MKEIKESHPDKGALQEKMQRRKSVEGVLDCAVEEGRDVVHKDKSDLDLSRKASRASTRAKA